jgi:hypothetical protein
MLTRSELRALPLDELARLADATLRASAERYGWRPMRAAGLPASLLVEVVLAAQLRAAFEAASHERAVGSQSTHEQR